MSTYLKSMLTWADSKHNISASDRIRFLALELQHDLLEAASSRTNARFRLLTLSYNSLIPLACSAPAEDGASERRLAPLPRLNGDAAPLGAGANSAPGKS